MTASEQPASIRAERDAGPLEVDGSVRPAPIGQLVRRHLPGARRGDAAPCRPFSTDAILLALGPAVVALAIAWRERGDALRRLARGLVRLPDDPRWWLVLLIPLAWALAVIGVAVLLGEPTAGLFDGLFPGIVIVPLVVLLPALAEELAWRGFAIPRLLSAMGPPGQSPVGRSMDRPARDPAAARPGE